LSRLHFALVLRVLRAGLPGHCSPVSAALCSLVLHTLVGGLVLGTLLTVLALLSLRSMTGTFLVLLTLLRDGYAARCEQRKRGNACQQFILLRPHWAFSFTFWMFAHSTRAEGPFPAEMHLPNADSPAKFLQTLSV